MEVIEAFIFILMFFGLYGSMVGLGWLIDKLLRKTFGWGIFPEGYFE
jgi:hypothetical protein